MPEPGNEKPVGGSPAGNVHDEYGKTLLIRAAGEAVERAGPSVEINYGAGGPARIDATVAGQVAVEVEARVSKQIRGALLDLICHTYPKKLLVIIPKHASNPSVAAEQCRQILGRFLPNPGDFRVVLAQGTGHKPRLEEDTALIRDALEALGVSPPTPVQSRKAPDRRQQTDRATHSSRRTTITLGETYYKRGFFNVGVADADRIGDDREPIAILLPGGGRVDGYIDRRAQGNGTPRIIGRSALRDWLQSNYRERDTVPLEIITPTCIRLG